jgi:carbamoyl-phosphate synthase/aspartate carbamoyltransferase/dihydroorotase
MLQAEKEGRLTKEQLHEKLYKNPKKIFNVDTRNDTKVEVTSGEFELRNEDLKTKCGWTPFAGRKVPGKVEKVTLRGEVVYEKGKVLAKPGSGKIIS